jgi:hypothetical protein
VKKIIGCWVDLEVLAGSNYQAARFVTGIFNFANSIRFNSEELEKNRRIFQRGEL